MKTAEQWSVEFPVSEEHTAMYEQEKIKHIKQIQLDAFKAGIIYADERYKTYVEGLTDFPPDSNGSSQP